MGRQPIDKHEKPNSLYGPHEPVPLHRDGLHGDTPITWDDIESRLDGRPWPKREPGKARA